MYITDKNIEILVITIKFFKKEILRIKDKGGSLTERQTKPETESVKRL